MTVTTGIALLKQAIAFAGLNGILGGAMVALVWCIILYVRLRLTHRPQLADTAFHHAVRALKPALAIVWFFQYYWLLLFRLIPLVLISTSISAHIEYDGVTLQLPMRFGIIACLNVASYFYYYLWAGRRSMAMLGLGIHFMHPLGRKCGFDFDEILAMSDTPRFLEMTVGNIVLHAVIILLITALWIWILSTPLWLMARV